MSLSLKFRKNPSEIDRDKGVYFLSWSKLRSAPLNRLFTDWLTDTTLTDRELLSLT